MAGDDTAGVCFTGPAGIGTTACALETAYSQAASFPTLLWHQVDLPGNRIGGSLERFAEHLDRQAPDLGLRPALHSPDALTTQLAKIRYLLRNEAAVLLVLDNIDPLLTTGGGWRDDRWGRVLHALSPGGLSRVVLTGTRPPADPPAGVAVVEVPPLAPLEAVVLARAWPGLGPLLRQGDPRLPGILTAAGGTPSRLVAADTALVRGAGPPTASEPAAAYTTLVRQFR
jgi:hypothetical protein